MPVYWASSAGIITSAGPGLVSELAVCKLAMVWLGEDPDDLVDVTTVTSTSRKAEILCNIVYDACRKAVLEDGLWQFAKRFQQLTRADGYSESGYDAKDITGITAADPAVVTAVSHGFSNGQLVRISAVEGMTEINSRVVRVANQTPNTFECYDLNSSQFTAYASGGEVVRFEAVSDYQNGYAYRVPTDLLKPVALIPQGQFEVIGYGDDRRLLCLQEDPVLEYVSDVTVVAYMTDHFKRTWAARIAAELAPGLQKKGAGGKDMWQHYLFVRGETKRSDAQNISATELIRNSSPTATAGGWQE